ncbi:longitudinals lacking protein, isoforms H/M/V-like [Anopheles bellator]|uniref:longitudinals lacking protein, isoforms H/M/V-like n=1 Tax=Anopheles bellator TaxID=139047 RepID=UPI002648ED2A|nr:longitudinals lacking protein, isoforms H/M/V-like [Anopheles bellator]
MEQFSLCWNSFRDNLAEGFQSLYENGELFDVVIVCDGKEFKAHRDILAACSPFFRSILVGNSSGNPIIILNDVPDYVMKLLLRFIYYGSVIVNNADLSTLMKHAEKLRIKGLTQRHRAHPEDSPEGPPERPTPPGTATGPLSSPYNGYGGPTAAPAGTGTGDDPHATDGAVPPSAQPLYSVLVNTFLGRAAGAGCEDGTVGSSPLKQPKLERSAESPSPSPYPPADYGEAAQPFEGSARSLAGPGAVHADHVEQQLDALRPLFPSAYDCTAAPGVAGSLSRSMAGGDSMSSPPLPDGAGMDAPLSPSGAPVSINVPAVAPGEKWFQGRLQFMLSQRGKPLLVHDGHSFGIQYIRKDKKYWQCNLSRKYNCKARVTTTDTGDIIVTNNEHCHTEIRQHLRKDYKTMKLAASLAASRASFEATNLAVASTSSSTSVHSSSDFYVGPVAVPPVTADQEMRSLNLSWTFNRESNKCND